MSLMRDLTSFIEVASLGSINKAAEALGYTPSAVSQQIRKLEKRFNVALFTRYSWGVSITDAGEIVLRYANEMRRSLDSIDRELKALHTPEDAPLVLGTFPLAGAALVGPAVSDFIEMYREQSIHLRSDILERQLDLLHENEVDMAVLWELPQDLWEEKRTAAGRFAPDLERVPLCDDYPVIVTTNTYFGGSAPPAMNRETLSSLPWISRVPGHPVDILLKNLADIYQFEPEIVFKAQDYQEAQAMVSAGLGVTLGYSFAFQNLREGLSRHPIAHSALNRQISVAYQKGKPLTVTETRMIDMLRSRAKTIGHPYKDNRTAF